MRRLRADYIAAAFLLIAAILFCGRATLTGRALLPLDLLLLMSPWKAHVAKFFPDFFAVQNPLLDPVQQYYPWRAFAIESIKSGVIPLWNPYSYCGQPFLANLQSAIFYPPNAIFLLLPLTTAFTWGAVLHLFFAGLFTFLLLRQWRTSSFSAVVAAVAFMFCGYIVGWLEYPAFGQWVICWLPAILLFHEKAVSTGKWWWILVCGIVIGFQFLGGQLQISAFLICVFLLFMLWKGLFGAERKFLVRSLVFGGIALSLGLMLAMVQLLPTLELAPLCARQSKNFTQARAFAFPLSHIVLYFIPNFFGNDIARNYWGNLVGYPHVNFLETGCYVGIITLLLAWLSVRLWRRPIVGFLLVLTTVSLLMALGSPLYAIFFYLVPGAKQLAGLGRWLALTAFGLAALAAIGIERIMKKDPPLAKWELPIFALVALGVPAVICTTYLPVLTKNPPLFDNFVREGLRFVALLAAALFIVWRISLVKIAQDKASRDKKASASTASWKKYALVLVALALLVLDLFVFGMRFNPATDARLAYFRTAATDYLRQESGSSRMTSWRPTGSAETSPKQALEWMLPNTPLVYKLRDVHGYDSLVPGYYTNLMGTTDWSEQGKWPASESPLADLLGIKVAMTTEELSAAGWELAESMEAMIYINQEVQPRAFIVSGARSVSEEECLRLMKEGAFDFRNEVLFIESAEAEFALQNKPLLAVSNRVRFITDKENTVELEVSAAEGGWLVLSDTAYPGWRVSVDGEPQPWQRANYAFRATKVAAGESSVKWYYAPACYKVGLFISLFGLSCVMAAIGYGFNHLIFKK